MCIRDRCSWRARASGCLACTSNKRELAVRPLGLRPFASLTRPGFLAERRVLPITSLESGGRRSASLVVLIVALAERGAKENGMWTGIDAPTGADCRIVVGPHRRGRQSSRGPTRRLSAPTYKLV